MDTRFVYTNDDGGVSVIMPAPEMFNPNSKTRELLRSRGVDFNNDEEILAYIASKDVPEGKSYRRVHVDELPAFRDFRNAWIDNGEAIVHDVEKANDLKRDQLRELRAPKLEALDISYMRADEAKDEATKASVAAEKQVLRDVTNFEDIHDIEALKDYMPDVLK